MIKAVIFDVEGVLVNTEEYQYKAWRALAHEQGLTVDTRLTHRLMGRGRLESLRMLLQQANRTYTDAELLALSMRKGDLFMDFCQQMSSRDVMPGSLENIEQLKALGIPVAAASSSRCGRFILHRCELNQQFDVIVDGTDVENNKPDPELYRLAGTLLKTAFRDCLVVEDAENGIEAAKKIGMQVLALGESMGDKRADYSAQNLDDILIADLIGGT